MQCINNLILEGYTYIIIPKKSRSKFYATKEVMVNGDFRDDTVFDEFKLTTPEEKEEFKVFDRNTFIKIWG